MEFEKLDALNRLTNNSVVDVCVCSKNMLLHKHMGYVEMLQHERI